MGEYAGYKQGRIKIGTCEDMYYLRYDQRHAVRAESGNVDPVSDAAELRFRFPWPDEDHIEPGAFEDYHRAIAIPGMSASADVEHHSIQFTAHAGYLAGLPCPESGAYNQAQAHGALTLTAHPSIRVHRNGFGGAVQLVAQKFRPGIGLVPILKCGGCGSMWRAEDRADIEEVAMRLRSAADGYARIKDDSRAKFYHAIADRVLAGLTAERPEVRTTVPA